jgi:hypothetical protein
MNRAWEDLFGEPEPPLPTAETMREDQRRMNRAASADSDRVPAGAVTSLIRSLEKDYDWVEDSIDDLIDDGSTADLSDLVRARNRYHAIAKWVENRDTLTWDELSRIGNVRRRSRLRIQQAIDRLRVYI